MLFNSLSFLLFFPAVALAYFLIPRRFQKHALLLASCFFYAYLAPAYLVLFLELAVFDFALALSMERARGQRRRNFFIIGIVSNLSVLFFFKYFDFFNTGLSGLAAFLHWNYGTSLLSIALPIGLSFVVFQSISYVVEVYRGNYRAESDFITYALYVMFFPKLLAGPIERPAHLLPQLKIEHRFDLVRIQQGLQRMGWGFFKKLVIADNIAILVAHIYSSLPHADGPTLLVLAILYPFQIYADFSGYSDIAVGSALIFGIVLTENFNRPFASRSIKEYWQRWHISLSSWLRDYLYYPLAFSGGKKTPARKNASLFVTFIASGLWHGAAWTYLAFGIFNGIVRILNSSAAGLLKSLWSIVDRMQTPGLTTALQIISTFCLTMVSLIFFGAPTINDAWFVLMHMTAGLGQLLNLSYIRDQLLTVNSIGITPYLFMVIIAAIVIMEIAQYLFAHGHSLENHSRSIRWSAYLVTLVAIWYFGNLAPIPFIYFKF